MPRYFIHYEYPYSYRSPYTIFYDDAASFASDLADANKEVENGGYATQESLRFSYGDVVETVEMGPDGIRRR